MPLGVLDRFKLAGVIASWWTETLPDFKTLIENGFCGVVDGWIDAIADAVEDEDGVGPAFDPFAHKLVLRTMADYLQQIADAKAEIARLKGEKEAFEQSNPPEVADEEELDVWNYAKDLERQIRENKAENKGALKELAKLEKAAGKNNASKKVPTRRVAQKKPSMSGRGAEVRELNAEIAALNGALQPVFDQLAVLEAALAPYEHIKMELAAARARYRALTGAFVNELKTRCSAMSDEEKQTLVLELFAQDVKVALEAAVNEKRQELLRFLENFLKKYGMMLRQISLEREKHYTTLNHLMRTLGYS